MLSALTELLWAFFRIGTFSIGGGYAVIPLIEEVVVRQNGWVSRQAFTDMITISQMTPGPLAVNISTFTGMQIAGVFGALAATFGCVISGILIAIGLHRFFQKHRESVYVFEVLNGLKAASLGLIVSASATILIMAFFRSGVVRLADLNLRAVVVFGVSLALLRKWKINPILLLALTGLSGLL